MPDDEAAARGGSVVTCRGQHVTGRQASAGERGHPPADARRHELLPDRGIRQVHPGRCRDPGRLGVLRALAGRARRPSWPTSTRCCSPTRTPITPGSPSGPAPRPARGCGSTARTSRPRAPAQAGKRDGKITSYLLRAAFYRTTFSLLRRGGGRMIPIAEVSAFADGEQIDVPGLPRAVHAPGHTPGSAALLVESRRALLTGDVMATENPLTGQARPADHAVRAEHGHRPGARLAGRLARDRRRATAARAR